MDKRDELLQELQNNGGDTFKALQNIIHEMAVEKGWYDPPKTFTEAIALCHSELSEALEEYRRGIAPDEYYILNGKPEGVPIELADCIIRIMDMCGHYNIPLWDHIILKVLYNATRSMRHGNKVV